MSKKKTDGLQAVGDIIKPIARQIKRQAAPTPIQQRLIDAAAANADGADTRAVLYQHSVFCQTYFPYRNPGDEIREWERFNGKVHLEVRAGKAMHPAERRLVKVGLPYGPKCRLVLMHINQLALRAQSPHIEVEDSLTAFVRRILKLDPKGRNIRDVKDQLGRLASSDITLGVLNDGLEGTDAATGYLRIVQSFNIWFPKDESQRILWPGHIDLSPTYFETLQAHAVPLDERHIAPLSHSSMALDIYVWLAQRLHRIAANRPALVPWTALHAQFGQGYNPERMDKFRQVFREALRQVLIVYATAKITEEECAPPMRFKVDGCLQWRQSPARGLKLHHSPPPVPPRSFAIVGKP